MSKERRRYDRIKVHHPSVAEIEGTPHQVIVSNLSRHGVCFHSPLKLEGEGALKMAVPGLVAERNFIILYQKQSGEDFAIGARFKDVAQEDSPMNNVLAYLASKQEFEGRKFDVAARPFFGDRAPD